MYTIECVRPPVLFLISRVSKHAQVVCLLCTLYQFSNGNYINHVYKKEGGSRQNQCERRRGTLEPLEGGECVSTVTLEILMLGPLLYNIFCSVKSKQTCLILFRGNDHEVLL